MQQVTRSEIARLAGVSRAAVTQWTKRHPEFPRPGGNGRFHLSEVLTWLEARKARRPDLTADRVRRSWTADASRRVPVIQLPGDGATGRTDNLILQLTLIFLHIRDPYAWAGLTESVPPSTGTAGARWLLGRIAIAAVGALRRHGVRPEVFSALQRLAPDRVSEVRGLMVHCSRLGVADVQAIVDAYAAVLPPGSFLTPRAVANLLAEAVIDDTAESVYDPYIRGRELLTAAAGAAGRLGGLRLHGLGSDAAALSLSGLNLLTRGLVADLRPATQAVRLQVTHVLANPPFGIESWIDWRPDSEWQPFPVPPRRSAFRWLLHGLQRLSSDGRMAIIMPAAAAFSANGREKEIRRLLVSRSMLEAVIALPSGLYAGPNVATSVWIVRSDPGSDQPILFIDGTHLEAPGDGQTMVDEPTWQEALQAWQSFRDDRGAGRPHAGAEGLSVAVAEEGIRQHNYNLNPAQYVPEPKEPPPAVGNDIRIALHAPYQRAVDCRLAADPAAALISRSRDLQTVQLADVCGVKAGYSYSRLPADQRSNERGVPIVLPRHLRDGLILADKPPLAPREIADGLWEYELKPGDVLCVRTGALTPPALVGAGQAGWLVSTNLLRLRIHDPEILNPYYLYTYLRSAAGQEQMTTFARATATAYVAAADVAAMKIPLPSTNQQQSLVTALRTLDDEAAAARALATEVAEARDVIVDQLFGGAR